MLIEDGAPGWLHVLVVLCIWNAMKFAIMGPVSIVVLLRASAARGYCCRSCPNPTTPSPDASLPAKAESIQSACSKATADKVFHGSSEQGQKFALLPAQAIDIRGSVPYLRLGSPTSQLGTLLTLVPIVLVPTI